MTDNIAGKQRGRRVGKGLRYAGGCSLTLLLVCALLLAAYKWNSRTPELTIPTLPAPVDNAYNDFVRAGNLAGQMAHSSPYDMSGTTAQNLTYANFKACAPDAVPVQRAVQAGLKKEYLCPPVRSANALQFPQYALFRKTARVLAGKAGYEEVSGHPGQAADTLLDMLEESVTLPRGGPLIAGLVAIACESITTRPLETLIPKLSPAELAHVAKRLNVIAAKRVPYADIITEEGNVSTALLLEMLRKPSKGGLPFNVQDLTGSSGALTWQDRLLMIQLMFTSKETLVKHEQNYFKALAEEAKQPYAGASKVPTGSDPLLNVVAPVFSASRTKFLVMESIQAIIRVEVALERYQRAHGQYPAELAQLTPTYLQAVPLDPCINAPLHYECKGNGKEYVLYSVGADQQDNHAQPQKAPGDGAPGDLVAHHLWRPIPPIAMPGKRE